MLTAKKAFEQVKQSAEKIRNDSTQRFPEAASVGDVWRQGDLYVELLAGLPANAKPVRKPASQLAPGTTQGSRHVLDSLKGASLYELANATALDGPVLLLAEERTITHPEHGDLVLPPGCYGVTYQRAYADELRRQAD